MNVNSVEHEWGELLKELSADEAKDGRKCFACGALWLLAEIAEHTLDQKRILAITEEVRQVLGMPDEPG